MNRRMSTRIARCFIQAKDEDYWPAEVPLTKSASGHWVRVIQGDKKTSVRIIRTVNNPTLVVLKLSASITEGALNTWRISAASLPVSVRLNRKFAMYVLVAIHSSEDSRLPTELTFEPASKDVKPHSLMLSGISVMPLKGQVSRRWASVLRRTKDLLLNRRHKWSELDFPYSHFDGLGYLLRYRCARQSVTHGRHKSAFDFFLTKGQRLGHDACLATERAPNAGTSAALYQLYERTLTENRLLKKVAGRGEEENRLLLSQLHDTQELLEQSMTRNQLLQFTINRTERFIDKGLKSHVGQSKAIRQLEDVIRLQHFLGPDILLPRMRNMPISPDFGMLLISLVMSREYDSIVEFGSGVSTLLVARAIQRIAHIAQRPPTPFLSFDHDPLYYSKTSQLLRDSALTDLVALHCAPLTPLDSPSLPQPFYDNCCSLLNSLGTATSQRRGRALIIVDGPPASTGPLARYPALPTVCFHSKLSRSYDFLLDDYIRKDEQSILSSWTELLEARSIPFRIRYFKALEKQAVLLSVGATELPDI